VNVLSEKVLRKFMIVQFFIVTSILDKCVTGLVRIMKLIPVII
jgi:hypothetical protein